MKVLKSTHCLLFLYRFQFSELGSLGFQPERNLHARAESLSYRRLPNQANLFRMLLVAYAQIYDVHSSGPTNIR